jgi:exodeoxyribonuclease VII small subunit
MSNKKNDLNELNYEQASQELEEIVTSLENNQGSLDESMALFERGQKLAEYCAGLLEKAELKVKELNAETAGEKENE